MENYVGYLELFNFWKNNGFTSDIAKDLNMAFWQCSISQVQAMSDAEINRRMHEDTVFQHHHKILVMRLVHQARYLLHQARDSQSPSNIPNTSPSHNPDYQRSRRSHSGNPDESRSDESPSRNPPKDWLDMSIHGQSTVNNYFV